MADGMRPDDGEGLEIDLRDRLLFAAGSLAADIGEALPAERAEELIFTSADRLLAVASVTEFVPILAERHARRLVRSGAVPTMAQGPVPGPRIGVPTPRPAVPAPRPAVPAPRPAVPLPRSGFTGGTGHTGAATAPAPPSAPPAARPANPPAGPVTPPPSAPAPAVPPGITTPRPGSAPLLAVPDGQLTRLRDDVERARRRVAEWQAGRSRR
jgi:hypothetical protein